MHRRPVYIAGVAVSVGWADASKSLTDLIFEVTREALDNADMSFESIDSVVLSAHDLVDGRSLSSMVTGPAAGAYLKDEIRFGDDGGAAFAAAITRIESGDSEHSIVAAWGRSSEGDPDTWSASLFDPFYGRPLGLRELTVSALRVQSWRNRFDGTGRDALVAARHAAAALNPRAVSRDVSAARDGAPYSSLAQDELPGWADVAVAFVLSSTPGPVVVTGLGQSAESFFVGDRDLLGMPALSDAVARALNEAGRTISDIDVVELDAMTVSEEVIAAEVLGLAELGGGFETLAQTTNINPSGGAIAAYSPPTCGLLRIAEAYLQLLGEAGPVQLEHPKVALATGSSIVASQTQTAVVLEVV